MDKNTLRKKMLQERKMLSVDFCTGASRKIFEVLKGSGFLNSKNNVLIYSDFKNEVITDDIIDYLLLQKRAVYLPKCDTDNHTISIERIIGAKTKYRKNIYGIDEPICADENISTNPDCAIVPGIAFDIYGNRLGFGVGYYDRFFAANKGMLKIALAYDFQVLDDIPHEENDIAMDIIITEKRIICVSGKMDKGIGDNF